MRKILTCLMLLTVVFAFSVTPIHATTLSTRTLWAGKHYNAGTVTVEVQNGNLIVTYQTSGAWVLIETHLYASKDEPTKSAPGKFPYKHENLGGVTSDQYIIPLSDLSAGSGDIIYIAAHAVVQNLCWCVEETGWAYGCFDFGKGWAMYGDETIP